MKIETTLQKRNAAVSRLRDYYSAAKFYFPTAREMNEEIAKIKAANLAKCPEWAKAYFDGVAAQLVHELYSVGGRLVFGGYVNGVFYSTYRNRPDYYEKHGIEPSEYADNGRVTGRGHYWIDDNGNVTKPYFID